MSKVSPAIALALLVLASLALVAFTKPELFLMIYDIDPKLSVLYVIENAQYDQEKGMYIVQKGQKLNFKVTISVASDSPIPLNGFDMCIAIMRPDGSGMPYWYDYDNEYIEIGQSKTYRAETDFVADMVGKWRLMIFVQSPDRTDVYYIVDTNFIVVEPSGPLPEIPKAEITVEEIAGGMALAGMLVAGIYLISKIRR